MTVTRCWRANSLSLALLVLTTSCSAGPEPAPVTPAEQFAQLATTTEIADAQIKPREDGGVSLSGRLQGATFGLSVPPNWNGEAMVYAYGYTTPGTPVDVDPDPAAKDRSGGFMSLPYSQGYIVAHSAYDKAGIGVETGATNTLRLADLVRKLGARDVYLNGGSMGGNIVIALIEKHPGVFKGALAACGVTTGWHTEIEHLTDLRAVYQFYTRGTRYTLPGEQDLTKSAFSLPPPGTPEATAAPARLSATLRLAGPIAQLFRDALAAPDGEAASIVRRIAAVTGAEPEPASFVIPLLTIALGQDDMVQTFGGQIYGNRQKSYGAPMLTPEETKALNEGVGRLDADAGAIAYADRWRRTTGRYTTPLVAMHNRIDSLVPYDQFEGLLEATAKAGNQKHLLAFTVPETVVSLPASGLSGYSHCGFTPQQIEAAWNALTEWTRTGVKPTPPDFISAATFPSRPGLH